MKSKKLILSLGVLFNNKNSNSLEDFNAIATIPVRFNEIPVEFNISNDKKNYK